MHVVGNTMCSLTYTYRLKLHKMRYKVASCLCLRDYVAGYEYMRSNAPCTCNMGRHSGAWSQRRTRARSPFAGVPNGRGPNNRTATITIPLLRNMTHLQVRGASVAPKPGGTYVYVRNHLHVLCGHTQQEGIMNKAIPPVTSTPNQIHRPIFPR